MQKIIKLTSFILFVAMQLSGFAQPKAGFSASSTTGCEPLVVSFNNTSSNAQSYIWDFGNGNTSTIQSPSIIYQTPGKYTVKLIAKDSIGNADSLVQVNYITVLPSPTAQFSYTVSGTCAGHVTVQCNNQSNTSNSFLWSFGDGLTSNQVNPKYTYSNGGSYNITLKVTSGNGCSATYTHPQSVVVRNNPTAQFTTSSVSSCDSNHVFTYQPTGSSITSYQWSFGDGTSSATSNPTHAYNTTGQFNVRLITTNQWGCKDTVLRPKAITLFKPVLPVVLTDKKDGCSPLAVSFKLNNLGSTNVLWNLGNSASLSGDSIQYTYHASGAYGYSIQFTDSNGCQRNYLNIDSILVYPSPVAAFSANKLSGCLPLQVNFINQSTGANNYSWKLGNGSSSNQPNPSYTYNKNTTYPIELKAVSRYGCTNVAYDTIRILNTDLKFNADIQTGCAPLKVNFLNLKTGITKFHWSFGDGDTSNLQKPAHTYQNLGNYNVCLNTVNTHGCSDSVCSNAFINVQNPVVPFGPALQFNECAPFHFNVNPGNKGFYSWIWNFGDGTISNNKVAGHTYNKAGTYKVYLTSFTADSCKFRIQYATVNVSSGSADFNYSIVNCTPSTVQFTDSSKNAVSWHWDFGDGKTSTSNNPVNTYSIPGIYLVTLTVQTHAGCSFTKSMVITTFNNTCPPPTNYSPSATPGNHSPVVSTFKATGCAPYSIGFAPLFPNAVGVKWDFGDGTTSTAPSPIHNYSAKGVYTLKLIAQLPSNITDTLSFVNSINIGDANATFNVSNALSCRWDSITATPVDQSLLNYHWKWNNGDTSNMMIAQHTLQFPDVPYHISLATKDSMGCSANSNTIISWSYPFNEIHIPDSFCYNHPLTIVPKLPTGYSYQIDYGDGYVGTKSHAYGNPGTYKVSIIVTDSMQCTQRFELDSITIWMPSVAVIGDRNYCLGDTIFLQSAENSASCSWLIDSIGASNYTNYIRTIASKTGQFDLGLKVKKDGCTVHKVSKLEINIQKPQADFQYSYQDMCYPTAVQLTDTSSSNQFMYHWVSSGNNTTGKSSVHSINKFPASITLYVEDSLGCKDTISKTITKPAPPVALVNKFVGCADDSIKFTMQGMIPKNTQILWVFDDGKTGTGQTVYHRYTLAGKYTAYAIVNYNNTCTDTISISSDITIGAPKAGITADSLMGCAPHSVKFNNGSTDYSHLKWQFGDGSNSSLPDPVHIYSNPGKYYVSLIAGDSLGCSDTTQLTIPVEVLGPTAKLDFTDSLICAGSTIGFVNQSSNYSSCKWYFGDGQTATTYNPTIQFKDKGTFRVTLIVNDTNGCQSTYTDSTVIKVNPNPQAKISLSRQSGCAPMNLNYKSLWHADTVSWSFGNGQISSLDSGMVQYVNPGGYPVQLILINEFGCTDTAIDQFVQVYDKPHASFTVNSRRNCYGSAVVLAAHGDTSYHYTWIVDNMPIANGNKYQLTAGPGWHHVSLITQNKYGCTDTISQLNSFFVHDTVPLTTPQINRVSVLEDTSTVLEWNPVLNSNLKSYRIFRAVNGGQYQLIANVNSGALTYIDQGLNTLTNIYGYKILAQDSCGIVSEPSIPHETINISAISKPDFVDVSWSSYKGATPQQYTLYRKSYYDTAYTELATLKATENGYRDSSIACTGYYSYKIIAHQLNQTAYYSMSDTATIFADGAISTLPAPEIIRATVIDDEDVYVEWNAAYTPAEQDLQFELIKSVNDSASTVVAVLPYGQRSYTDKNTDVHNDRYTYVVRLKTSCGFDVSSNKGSSILLTATDHQNKEIMFKWNEYKEWDGGVERYELQELDESGNWVTVKTSQTNKVTINKQ